MGTPTPERPAPHRLATDRAADQPAVADRSAPDGEQNLAPHVRRLRVRAIRDRLRESLLFLPGLMLAGTVAAALVLGELDNRLSQPLPFAVTFAPDVVISLLGTIAGATITTAGVVFSLLVVSLQLASGQFSPRVLRGFWRDRYGQVLVGLLLSTFAFCVLALARVDTAADSAPELTVLCAMLLTLASVVSIVVYLDRIIRQQYVGRIMQRVMEETHVLIAELPYGAHIGARIGRPVPPPDLDALGAPLVIQAYADGWVQQISRRALLAAVPPGSVVRLETRVGAYLVKGSAFATVWPQPAQPERVARLVGEAAIIGPARTMQQDVDFGLRQLNDIALRALSTAVNDPTTAIEAVLRISSVMRPLLLADLPAQSVRDAYDRILLTPWNIDHTEYIAHAFDQLRRYAAPHPQIILAIVRNLRMLRAACQAAGDRADAVAALDRQLRLAVSDCRQAGVQGEDLARVEAAAH